MTKSPDIYTTRPLSESYFESHRKFIDVQYMIEGIEEIYVAKKSDLKIAEPYDEARDVVFYRQDLSKADKKILKTGEYLIFYPEDAHMPSVAYEGVPSEVKKIVFKVEIK